jgi:hypothetical protein
MSDLVQRFQQFHQNGTRQIGRYFCIPAVVSNATRVLGSEEYTQEKIRAAWYAMKERTVEPDIHDQMTGAGPDVVQALVQQTDFDRQFGTTSFELEPERSLFNAEKADRTIRFIAEEVNKGNPVLVSTDIIPWERGILASIGFHMWLVLQLDLERNIAVCHDPGDDLLFSTPIRMAVPVALGDQTIGLEIGLRGKVTRSNYFCLSFWKR